MVIPVEAVRHVTGFNHKTERKKNSRDASAIEENVNMISRLG
jgi:hypothetical protein